MSSNENGDGVDVVSPIPAEVNTETNPVEEALSHPEPLSLEPNDEEIPIASAESPIKEDPDLPSKIIDEDEESEEGEDEEDHDGNEHQSGNGDHDFSSIIDDVENDFVEKHAQEMEQMSSPQPPGAVEESFLNEPYQEMHHSLVDETPILTDIPEDIHKSPDHPKTAKSLSRQPSVSSPSTHRMKSVSSHQTYRSSVKTESASTISAPKSSTSPPRPKSRMKMVSAEELGGLAPLIPIYSTLMEGVYERPVVVSILVPQQKPKREKKVVKTSVVSMSHNSATNSNPSTAPGMLSSAMSSFDSYDDTLHGTTVASSRQQQQQQQQQEDAEIQFYLNHSSTNTDTTPMSPIKSLPAVTTTSSSSPRAMALALANNPNIPKTLKYFILKVNDIITNKEAQHSVVLREYVPLYDELVQEFQDPVSIAEYYKPTELSWWIRYLKHFLLIYHKPNAQLSVIVNKKFIRMFVKKKLDHHYWMKASFQSAAMSPTAAGATTSQHRKNGGGPPYPTTKQNSFDSIETTDSGNTQTRYTKKIMRATEYVRQEFPEYTQHHHHPHHPSHGHHPSSSNSNSNPSSTLSSARNNPPTNGHSTGQSTDLPSNASGLHKPVQDLVLIRDDACDSPLSIGLASVFEDELLEPIMPEPSSVHHHAGEKKSTSRKPSVSTNSSNSGAGGSKKGMISKSLPNIAAAQKTHKTSKHTGGAGGGTKHKMTAVSVSVPAPILEPPAGIQGSVLEEDEEGEDGSSKIQTGQWNIEGHIPPKVFPKMMTKAASSASLQLWSTSTTLDPKHPLLTGGAAGGANGPSPGKLTRKGTAPVGNALKPLSERSNELLILAYGRPASSSVSIATGKPSKLGAASMDSEMTTGGGSKSRNKHKPGTTMSISSIASGYGGSAAPAAAGITTTRPYSMPPDYQSKNGSNDSYDFMHNTTTTTGAVAVATSTSLPVSPLALELPALSSGGGGGSQKKPTIQKADSFDSLASTGSGGSPPISPSGGGGGGRFMGINRMGSMESILSSTRPVSPFEQQTQHLKGSAKVAAKIIQKARKLVSGDAKKQVKKISLAEQKLLESPFAKKLWVETEETKALLKKGAAAAEMLRAKALGKQTPSTPASPSSPSAQSRSTPIGSPNSKCGHSSVSAFEDAGGGGGGGETGGMLEKDLLMETLPTIVYEEGFFA